MEFNIDGVIWKHVLFPALGQFIGEHGAHHTVGIGYLMLDVYLFSGFQSLARQAYQLIIESLVQTVILIHGFIKFGALKNHFCRLQDSAEIQAACFPVINSVI